jgi:hypothetical protein
MSFVKDNFNTISKSTTTSDVLLALRFLAKYTDFLSPSGVLHSSHLNLPNVIDNLIPRE